MREGRIEPTVVPRNALDVLAQQIVAIAASAEPDAVGVDDLYALVTRTHSYAELPRELLENVLDMLDGRYPSQEFGELRPRIVWDRVAGTIRARKGARQLAVTNAGTIPDRGLFAVVLPDGRRVGELDEEMVYEARPGQTFLLGASTWRIEDIGRDRVTVSPAPGVPGAVPFWKGDGVGRPKELGREIGAFSRWAVDQSAGDARARLRPRPARREEPPRLPRRAAGGDARRPERPHDRRRALPRRDRRLAPVRAEPVRRARARRLGARAVARGSATSSASSPTRSGPTTASSSTSPTPTSRRASELVMLEPDEVEDAVVAELVVERAVRRALPRERRPRAADPARLSRAGARRCGSSG